MVYFAYLLTPNYFLTFDLITYLVLCLLYRYVDQCLLITFIPTGQFAHMTSYVCSLYHYLDFGLHVLQLVLILACLYDKYLDISLLRIRSALYIVT
jgi:hypothetical protein